MSSWFSVRLAPRTGSLAAASAGLAAAGVAIESIIGSPESEDGLTHLAVADGDLQRAVAALKAAGIAIEADEQHAPDSGGDTGLIGALLRGPRS